MNKTTLEKIQEKIAMLEAQNEALRIAKEEAEQKVKKLQKKEYSEIFVNKEREIVKYKNLSETKRFFEENYLNELQEKVTTTDKKLTSKEFHELLTLK